jgi:hypothetical protein
LWRLNMRDRSGGVDAEAEAGGEDERAPVSSGAARWLAAEARGGGEFQPPVAGWPF